MPVLNGISFIIDNQAVCAYGPGKGRISGEHTHLNLTGSLAARIVRLFSEHTE